MTSRHTSSSGTTSALGRIVSAAASIAQTRIEIFGIELAEEKDRLLSTLLLSLIALMVGMLALMGLTALVVIVLWDSYRWQPLAILSVIYVLIAGFCAIRVRDAVRHAPPPFETTRAEFENDRALFERHSRDGLDGDDHDDRGGRS